MLDLNQLCFSRSYLPLLLALPGLSLPWSPLAGPAQSVFAFDLGDAFGCPPLPLQLRVWWVHPTALVQHGLSDSSAWWHLRWVMSRVAAITVRQLYLTLKQKTRVTPADREGFPWDTRALLRLAVPSGIPHAFLALLLPDPSGS